MKILFGPNHYITMLMILRTFSLKIQKNTVLTLNIDSLNSTFDELNILIHTLAESNVFIGPKCNLHTGSKNRGKFKCGTSYLIFF